MSDAPLWVSFVQPGATVIAAVAVGYYAHQQWKLAQDKLRLDLFEKRYKVFEATREFMYAVLKFKGNFDDPLLMDFLSKTADAEFLFGPDVVKFITEVREKGMLAKYGHELHRPVPTDKTHLEGMIEKHHNLIEWFVARTHDLSKVFQSYLGYGNVRSGSWWSGNR